MEIETIAEEENEGSDSEGELMAALMQKITHLNIQFIKM